MKIQKILTTLVIPCLLALTLTSCSKQRHKKAEEETSERFLRKKAYAELKQDQKEYATETLELLLNKYPDAKDIHKFKLLLADLYFKLGKYPSAQTLYSHYFYSYPADKKAEYAQYGSILSTFYQTLTTDCDQSVTQQAIGLCKQYLDRIVLQKYRKDVTDIQNTCEHKIINKEIYVYNFYLKKGKYDAAGVRLKHLKKHCLPKKKSLEPRLLFLECKLAQYKKDMPALKDTVEQLTSRYPDSQFTRMAEAIVTKQTFMF